MNLMTDIAVRVDVFCFFRLWVSMFSINKGLLNQSGWIVDSYDFNRDGSLDPMEAQFAANAMQYIHSKERSFEEQRALFEASTSGIDIASFDFMGPEERREAIESAGLDSEDFDEVF